MAARQPAQNVRHWMGSLAATAIHASRHAALPCLKWSSTRAAPCRATQLRTAIVVARELTDKLRRSATINWQNRVSSRARWWRWSRFCWPSPLPAGQAAADDGEADHAGRVAGRHMGLGSGLSCPVGDRCVLGSKSNRRLACGRKICRRFVPSVSHVRRRHIAVWRSDTKKPANSRAWIAL